MEEKLIEFETAKLAKEKGFFIKTPKFYPTENPNSFHKDLKGRGILGMMHENSLYEEYTEKDKNSKFLLYQLNPSMVSAPTQSLLQKWLREKHCIYIWVYYCIILESNFYQIRHEISKNEYYNITNENNSNKMHEFTYEESLEDGLLEALKLIK